MSAVPRRCTPALINTSYLFLPEGKKSFLEEGDGSGNSCTIGSEIYLDVSYLHYLYDARLSISDCIRACQVWSAPYDGENPPPEKYQPGVLEDPGMKSRPAQIALKRAPQPLGPQPRPGLPSSAELPSVNQQELEWDDSYDACPVQTAEAPVETKPPQMPPAELPKHIQEMRRTAIMLVKGSYIEENEFQDDVMVYDLVAKKDSRDGDLKRKPSGSQSEEAEPGPAEVPLKNGLSLTLPSSLVADNGKSSLDTKAKGQTDCNANLQNTSTAELGNDLLAQYEELIRTLDTEAGVKAVKADAELKKPAAAVEDEEDEEEMDFTSFSAETPEPEKLHSPFGTVNKFRSGSTSRHYSLPFTGELKGIVGCAGLSVFIWRAPLKDHS